MDKDLLSSFKLHPGFAALSEVLKEEYSRLEQQLRMKPTSTDSHFFAFCQGEIRGGLDALDVLYQELEIEKGG